MYAMNAYECKNIFNGDFWILNFLLDMSSI